MTKNSEANLKKGLFTVLINSIILFICFLLFSLVLSFFSKSNEFISNNFKYFYYIYFIISSFILGYTSAKLFNIKAIFSGFICGIVYIIPILILYLIISKAKLTAISLITFFIILIVNVTAAVISKNKR